MSLTAAWERVQGCQAVPGVNFPGAREAHDGSGHQFLAWKIHTCQPGARDQEPGTQGPRDSGTQSGSGSRVWLRNSDSGLESGELNIWSRSRNARGTSEERMGKQWRFL